MPSFEPSYFHTSVIQLAEEREKNHYSKCNFEEHWEVLRANWNDYAGRNIDTRIMTPLVDVYAQFLNQSEQHIQTKEKISENFKILLQQLVDAAHHDEQHQQLSAELSDHSKERDHQLRDSENLVAQVEEQQPFVDKKKDAANSHVGLL